MWWQFGGSGFVGVPILSLILGLSFGSTLNFCCGYLCICKFMVRSEERRVGKECDRLC